MSSLQLQKLLRDKDKALEDFAEAADDLDELVSSFVGLGGDATGRRPRWTYFALCETVPYDPPTAGVQGVTPTDEDIVIRGASIQAYIFLAVSELFSGFEKLLTCAQQAETPSICAKSTAYNRYQAGGTPLLDGRFAGTTPGQTAAPPVELYHPIFAYFRSLVESATIQVPVDLIRSTVNLMRSHSQIHVQELPRALDTRQLLGEALDCAFVRASNSDRTSPDFVVHQQVSSDVAAVVFCEVKGELGAGGSDPSVQSSFSFSKYWSSVEVWSRFL